MKNNYNECLIRLLKDEGGYSNNPNDSGGPTNFGITLADYRLYIKKNGTANDVKNMTVDQAKIIYKSKYWDALDCDNLASGVDYTCFDYGVNSGLGRPKKALQKFKTLTGVQLINAINDERMTFLRAISAGKNAVFLKGWTARVARVRAYSLQLAGQPATSTATATKTAASAIAGGAVIATVASQPTYWQMFQNHWILYTLGVATLALIVDVLIHLYKNRKTTNV